MKVVALIQFYFDYVFPRSKDWDNQGLKFEFPEFAVTVRPRNSTEELFPNEIDKTLSGVDLSLVRLNLPVGQTRIKVGDRCHDRLEVRVNGEVESLSVLQDSKVQLKFFRAAVDGCDVFFNQCRVASRSPFVRGVIRHYRPEDDRFYTLTPHTITWFDGADGDALPVYDGKVNATASSGAIKSPESGSVGFALIRASLEKSPEPNISTALLVDSDEMLRTGRLNEAVVSVAMACEISVKEQLSVAGKLKGRGIRGAMNSLSFAEKYFDKSCKLAFGRSLKAEDLSTFNLIQNLYRTRNNIVHQGKRYYLDNGAKVHVDEKIVVDFLRAAEKTLGWLGKIQSEPPRKV